jgi:hypothetical protein
MFHSHAIVDVHCPHCGAVVAMLPFGICSWLGPQMYRCDRCGLAYDSGRLEWNDMPLKRKAWYLGVSLFYAAALGGLGGVSIAGCVHFLRNGPWRSEMPVGTWEQGLGTVACAVLISACQITRVFRSRERTRRRGFGRTEGASDQETRAEQPHRSAFWFGLPGFALFMVLVPASAGWLIALVLDRLS